jgi:UDP-N-acetyl-alpha-D-muramoyl-L-alanyl-L-glutamate epimerase
LETFCVWSAEASKIRELRLPGPEYDPATGLATLPYRLGNEYRFTETVQFPVPDSPRPVERVLDLLYLVAGVSYYKVAAPPAVHSETVRLAPAAARFVKDVYTKGLGEFAYRNDLPHVFDLDPDVGGGLQPVPASGGDRSRPLVCVGGGKDSIVTIEAIRLAGYRPVLFAVNPNRIIEDVAAASGLPFLAARRRIDPQVFELNRAGAYNGHIPVTAINSLIAVTTAALHGLGPVVMSNERSASAPNTSWHGIEINHQWSKSAEAEAGLRDALAAHAGLADDYFSLLRPYSELHIARMFAPTTRYDHAMTSCNKAYLLNNPTVRWCGDCPKCRFVFLALAPFVDRARLVDIFGKDMLADPGQIPGYLELLGIDGHKPFECVGEVAESLVAVQLLRRTGEWDESPVLAALAARVPEDGWPTAEQAREVFTAEGRGLVPADFGRVLDDLD